LRVEAKIARLLAGGAVITSLMCPAMVAAQSAPVVSQPVVQALPNPSTERLSAALTALGSNPRDVKALVDAGDAASSLGDISAALGFYRRADQASPNNPRAKAGIARAFIKNGDPVSAIPFFDAAEKAGATAAQIASDRGLAYDLVGDNATAQRYYAAAMSAVGGNDDELRMRLALSQAMSGDQQATEATLMPLLRKQDKPGWRTRAFAIAIGGDSKKAVEIVNTILPPQLAENIAPYLRYMPRLTKAQQAAAANLGRFPRASEIGRDDPRIAAYAPPRLAAADTALVPKGEPLDRGRKDKPAKAAKQRATTADSRTKLAKAETVPAPGRDTRSLAAAAPVQAPAERIAPPDPKPAIESTGELPPVGQSATAPAASPPPQQRDIAAASVAAPAQATPSATRAAPVVAANAAPVVGETRTPPATLTSASPAPVTAPASAPTPGFDLARVGATQAPPARQAAPAPSEPRRPSLEEIFAEFSKPTLQIAPVSGAVDIRKIEPARALPKPAPEPKVEKPAEKPKPKKPAPPAHPSRIWVQIGVGRDKDAIAFDWRRYVRQSPELFKGRKPYVSEMGRTNRILAGPFETQKAANQFIVDAKKAGFDNPLPWTSPAGQVVDALSAD